MAVYLKRYPNHQWSQRWGATPYPANCSLADQWGRTCVGTWVGYRIKRIRAANRRRLRRRPQRIMRLP